jgi:hypothetical protein
MNQKFTRCRKLLLALGLAITQACSHRPAELPSPLSSTSPSLSISEAQTWYQQLDPGARSTARTSQSGPAAPTVPPTAALRWQRALTVGMGSQQLVLVPFAGDAALFARTPYVGMRYLVVAKQAPASLDGKIVEVLLSRTTEQVDTLALFTSVYHSAQSGPLAAPGQGDGYVFLYSARYEYLTGRRFAQGQLLPGVTRLAFQPRAGRVAASERTAGHRVPSISTPCLDWYSGETGKYITTTGDCSSPGSGGSGEVPPVYTGGGGPCGGGCGGSPGPSGYGGGGGGGVPTTTTSPPLSPVTPCSIMHTLGADAPGFIVLMNNLKTNVNSGYETGYTYTMTGNAVTNAIVYQSAVGVASIDLKVSSQIDGYMHSHYTGLLSVFSGSDLRAIYELYNQGRVRDVKTFSTQLVTANGTTYALMINDESALKKFGDTWFVDGPSWMVFEGFFYDNRYNIKPTNTNEQNEKGFLSMINLSNMGLTLLKGNSNNFSSWTKIQLDAAGTVSPVSCP